MDDFDAEAIVKALGSLGDIFEKLGIAIQFMMEELSVVCNALVDQYGDPENEDQEDEDSESEQLKPCPFCGKSVATLSNAKELEDCCNFEDDDCCTACMDWSRGCGYHTVVCGVAEGGCGTSTGYFPTKDEAVAAWNRRSEKTSENAPGWISVLETEKLPKKSTPCIVACNQWGGEIVRKATFFASDKSFDEHGCDITEFVTHWMPSPEPPEGCKL